jgi:hypothetical protein
MRRTANTSRASSTVGWQTKAPLSGIISMSLSFDSISSAARTLVRLTE